MSMSLIASDHTNTRPHTFSDGAVVQLNRTVSLPDEMDVNMSESNAVFVMSGLGFSMDENGYYGDIPLQEMIDACQRYLGSDLGTIIDLGQPMVEDIGMSAATHIHCGRREGYLTETVIDRIMPALRYARANGATHICLS